MGQRLAILFAIALPTIAANSPVEMATPNAAIIAAAHNHRAQFCSGLKQYFRNRLPASWKPTEINLSADRATGLITQNLLAFNFSPYVSINEVLPQGSKLKKQNDRYFPVADALGAALGLKRQIIFSDTVSDLKFLPFSMQNRDLILAADSMAPLNAKRARAVIATARRLDIKVNIVWTAKNNDSPAKAAEAVLMAQLARQTGGSFVAIGGEENPCYSSF